jgi:hypothetical protein
LNASLITTETGLRAWFARRIELWSIGATLRWAESDRAFLAAQLDAGPKRLRQMDRDLEHLRMRRAILRSGL